MLKASVFLSPAEGITVGAVDDARWLNIGEDVTAHLPTDPEQARDLAIQLVSCGASLIAQYDAQIAAAKVQVVVGGPDDNAGAPEAAPASVYGDLDELPF